MIVHTFQITSSQTEIPLYIQIQEFSLHNQLSEHQRPWVAVHLPPALPPLEPAQQRSSDDPILALIPLLPFPRLPRQLLLRLLIPVRNQLVQEAAGLALVVAVFLGLFDLLLQVLVGLFVSFVGGVVR